MTPLDFIVEPERLLLTWQPRDESSPERSRRIVGEVWVDQGTQFHFRYLKSSEDFVLAERAGFEGFPAFDLKLIAVGSGVEETLLRRLPPRNREDFPEFLAQHRLPSPFPGSDLALLGYTGAKLPSDGFSLVPQFPTDSIPCDYITEIAGVRHVFKGDVSGIRAGDPVELAVDPENGFDPDAIEVRWNKQKVGYINRAFRSVACHWLRHSRVSATIDRVNGRPDRPLIYLRLLAR